MTYFYDYVRSGKVTRMWLDHEITLEEVESIIGEEPVMMKNSCYTYMFSTKKGSIYLGGTDDRDPITVQLYQVRNYLA